MERNRLVKKLLLNIFDRKTVDNGKTANMIDKINVEEERVNSICRTAHCKFSRISLSYSIIATFQKKQIKNML